RDAVAQGVWDLCRRAEEELLTVPVGDRAATFKRRASLAREMKNRLNLGVGMGGLGVADADFELDRPVVRSVVVEQRRVRLLRRDRIGDDRERFELERDGGDR